jgi:hypothetical protein
MKDDPGRLPAHLAFTGKTKADRKARRVQQPAKRELGESKKRGARMAQGKA